MRIYQTSPQQTIKRNGRLYAVRKPVSRTDYWAARNSIAGNWQAIMQEHKTARVMRNYKF